MPSELDKENADAKLAGELRQKAHRQKQNAEAQRRHQEKKKGGPLRNKAPDGYRKLTLEQQIAHPSGFYYTELEHASVKKEAVPPSPAVPKGCTGDAMSAGMETPKPKPVEMTEKSTPELFNAQSELDRAMKVAMNDKITAIREQDAAKEAEASKRARSLQVMKSRMRAAIATLVEEDDTQKLKHAEMEHEEVLDFAAIQDIARAERRKVAAKNDVEDLLAEIDEINAGKALPMTAHERQVSELQQQVVALKVVSEKKDVEIERVATLFRATVQKVATLDSGLQEMAKTNIVLTADLESAKVESEKKDAKIAELQVEVSQKDAKIAELQVEVSQKDVEVSCATNDMATAAQRVVTLDTELKQMGEINSNLAADLAHVTEEWETLQEDILEQKR